ncbi:MAG TPA: MarR family transcriptional regulator [Clostridiales bacterium]|nr:MarR family transcriptional regulator [Clostridiales bacterium]
MDRSTMLTGLNDKSILFGLFFAFDNQLQAAGDTFYEGITSKQFFLTICLSLFHDHCPTINELSGIMGSSHQNVRQIANKLERNGFIKLLPDEQDKRKVRIIPTDKLMQLEMKHKNQGVEFMERLFDGLSEEEIAITLKAMIKIESNLISIREGQK